MDARLVGCALLRRYRAGGKAAMLSERPISEREQAKTRANPPTRYDWAMLCMEKEHADAFEACVQKMCAAAQ